MTAILLTLVLGGSLTEHTVTAWSYDAGSQRLTYTEGGIAHTQSSICCVVLTGTTVDARTDAIFANGFERQPQGL